MQYTDAEKNEILTNVERWMNSQPIEGIMFLQSLIGMPVKDPGDRNWILKNTDADGNTETVASFTNPSDAADVFMYLCYNRFPCRYPNLELWHDGRKLDPENANNDYSYWH